MLLINKVRIPLKLKIVSLVIMVVVAALLIEGIITLNQSEGAIDISVDNYLSKLSDDIADQLYAANEKEFTVLRTLASIDDIKDDNISLQDKQTKLYHVVARLGDEYENIGFLDKKGMNLTRDGRLVDLSERDYFKQAIAGKEVIVDPYYSSVALKIFTTYAVPVRNFSDEIIGVLILHRFGNSVEVLCNSIDVGGGMHPWVINTRTKVVVADGNIEEETVDIQALENDIGLSNTLNNVLNGENGVAEFYSVQNSAKMTASYRTINSSDWSVFCMAPYDHYFGFIKGFKQTIAITIIAATVFSVIAIYIWVAILIRPLTSVRNAFKKIGSGSADLTRRIPSSSNDEIGDVVTGFNGFTENLQTIMTELKDSKESLITSGTDLSATAGETNKSISEIYDNINSVHTQIKSQINSVVQTECAVTEITSSIEGLENMIEQQSAGVLQATDVVEQMMTTITVVNDSMDNMSSSFEDLSQSASSGVELQLSVNDKIEEIKVQSNALQEANSAIAAIAEQTNLLAMNAAIEAAHAGDAGKGFSVVADEIRKLSETSSQQSKTIGNQLNNIRESIDTMVDVSEKSSVAFQTVSDKIKETDNLVKEVKSAMESQVSNSKSITDTIKLMNNSTTLVKDASKEMAIGNKSIMEEIKKLHDSADKVNDSMNDMSADAAKINQIGSTLSDITDNVKNSIQKIGSKIDLFSV